MPWIVQPAWYSSTAAEFAPKCFHRHCKYKKCPRISFTICFYRTMMSYIEYKMHHSQLKLFSYPSNISLTSKFPLTFFWGQALVTAELWLPSAPQTGPNFRRWVVVQKNSKKSTQTLVFSWTQKLTPALVGFLWIQKCHSNIGDPFLSSKKKHSNIGDPPVKSQMSFKHRWSFWFHKYHSNIDDPCAKQTCDLNIGDPHCFSDLCEFRKGRPWFSIKV